MTVAHRSPSRRRGRSLALGLGLALLGAGCARDKGERVPLPASFAPTLGVDVDEMDESGSGLYVQVLQEGQGEPAGDSAKIQVTYTGWLPDGTQFDSNDGREPLLVTLGKRFLIDGFMEGVEEIRSGEERLLVVPPELAYGPGGDPGVIPNNSWLVFRVRRVDGAAAR